MPHLHHDAGPQHSDTARCGRTQRARRAGRIFQGPYGGEHIGDSSQGRKSRQTIRTLQKMRRARLRAGVVTAARLRDRTVAGRAVRLTRLYTGEPCRRHDGRPLRHLSTEDRQRNGQATDPHIARPQDHNGGRHRREHRHKQGFQQLRADTGSLRGRHGACVAYLRPLRPKTTRSWSPYRCCSPTSSASSLSA